ncbi:hypothetical protein ACJX0J_032906, partial [Zea mays]
IHMKQNYVIQPDMHEGIWFYYEGIWFYYEADLHTMVLVMEEGMFLKHSGFFLDIV